MVKLLSPVGDALPIPSSLKDRLDAVESADFVRSELAKAAILMAACFHDRYAGFCDIWEGGENGGGLERCVIASSPRREDVVAEVREWRTKSYALPEATVTIDYITRQQASE